MAPTHLVAAHVIAAPPRVSVFLNAVCREADADVFRGCFDGPKAKLQNAFVWRFAFALFVLLPTSVGVQSGPRIASISRTSNGLALALLQLPN